jgi:ATP-dependent RNA helicase DDX54/DBP10
MQPDNAEADALARTRLHALSACLCALQEVPDFTLKAVEVVVFDEADRLFEMGFAEQLREILRTVPERRQTLLFSATMPKQLVQFARAGLQDPVLIRLDTERKVSENLSLAFLMCRSADKPACLLFLMREVIPRDQMTVVSCCC